MSDEHDGRDAARAEGGAAGGDASPAAVSVERLAERVYQLMLRDVRLERARGADATHRGR